LFAGLFGTVAVVCAALLDVLVVDEVVVVVVVDEAELDEEELLVLEDPDELEEPDADVDEAEEGRPVPVDWMLKAGE
jgi:hypothetical protein